MTTMMSKILKRIIKFPNQSFFLLGPRGTGKTTWVKYCFPDALNINLLNESIFQSYLADISLFSNEMNAVKPESWVFVDEIQRLPNLLNEVHRYIEEKKLKFILTGSSARKLRNRDVNLLAGRALMRHIYPFLPAELDKQFQLESVLKYGSLPVIFDAPDKEESLTAYVQMYLKEEIKSEALVRNLPGFIRFLPIAGLSHGHLLNISNIARDAGVKRTTVNGYIEILEDSLLTFRLPAFSSKLRIKEKKHPKLYWIDPGLVRAVNNKFGELYPEEKGALFEGWLAILLKTYKDYHKLFDEFYYWTPATAIKTEVDFILKKGIAYIAIEAKFATRLNKDYLKGLIAIKELDGIKKRILVYTGDRTMKTNDGIDVWPLDYFLEIIDEGKLWR
jgi:predicted AAA+ superfamily ATPase